MEPEYQDPDERLITDPKDIPSNLKIRMLSPYPVLLVEVVAQPVVDILYEPVASGPSYWLRVYKTKAKRRFRPGQPLVDLYIPHVALHGPPNATPATTRVDVQTVPNPDFPLLTLHYRTVTTAVPAASVPDGKVRHRLVIAGQGAASGGGIPSIAAANVEDAHTIAGQPYQLWIADDHNNPAFEFGCFWKRIVAGTDPTGPRHFFLQYPLAAGE